MKTDSEVLIAGGGLTGPVAALALAGAGVSATVIDGMPVSERAEPEFDGRAYALSLSTVRMLRAIGIWKMVEHRSCPISEIKISDGVTGKGATHFLHFQSAEIDEGSMGWILEDRYLRTALLSAMDNHDLITQVSGATVDAQTIADGCASVALKDGRQLRGRVLVGCDGRNSGVARRAGITRQGWTYSQTSLVCAVSHQEPHHGVAYQTFLPTGPLAILPLPGDRSSIVWTESVDRAEAIHGLDDAGYMAELGSVFGSFLGGLSLIGERFRYPLGLSVATQFIADRVALAGDSAHGIHPLAGQGLNLGLRDVAALTEILVDAHRRGEDMGSASALSRYQQWRRFDTAALSIGTDAINRAFSCEAPFLRIGRGIGLRLIEQFPGVQRSLIRSAAGLAGDLPRLLSGRSL